MTLVERSLVGEERASTDGHALKASVLPSADAEPTVIAAAASDQPPVLSKDWRFFTGVTALVLAVVLPLLALVVPFLGLSAGVSALLAGGLVVGAPEVLILLAAGLLGKQTLQYLTARVKRLFW